MTNKRFDIIQLFIMILIVLAIQTQLESYVFGSLKPSFVLPRRAVYVVKDDNIMSKRIPLTQSQFATVDDKDYEWLSKYKWCAVWLPSNMSFYAMRKDNKRHTVYMAREILGLIYGDKRQADHIHHNTLDNLRKHLRIVSKQQNGWNRKNPKGYRWHNQANKYQAHIRLNSKFINLGYFDTTETAHNAYLKAKKQYHKI